MTKCILRFVIHILCIFASMKTTVVILNWNGEKLLAKFLPSVVENSPEATVYVADNASTDGSVAFLKQYFPSVKIIQNLQNGGYAKGYNDALAFLEEDIFILLNNDVEVTRNWLTPILSCFENNPNTAAIQPKILAFKNPTYFEYAGAGGGFIDQLGYPFCRGRIFDTLEKDNGQYDDETDIFWASGACLAIRNKVFREVGQFDEDYFAHQEEIDLCWRIRNRGYAIKYIGKSSVYHLGGATLSAGNPKKVFYNFRNSLFNLVKNRAGFSVLFVLFLRLSLDGVAGIKFLLEGKPRLTWSVVESHISFYWLLRKMVRKRKQSAPKKIDSPIFSIVFDYFIKNKKNFRKL